MKWARCLRQQGVRVDDDPNPVNGGKPIVDEKSVPADKLRAAIEKCRQFAPDYGKPPPPPDPAADTAWAEQRRRFARCMREHGVDMPDSAGDAARPGAPTPGGPAWDSAVEACAKQVPGAVVPPTGEKGK